MSAALDRSLASPLSAYALGQSRVEPLTLGLCGVVAVFGLIAIALALTTQPMTESVDNGIRLFVGLCCLLAWVQGNSLAQSLARGAVVLGQRQVPQRLWADWLRVKLQQTALIWSVVTVACIVVLSTPTSPWRWPTAAAVVSLLMVLSLLRTLSSQGLLAAAVGWVIGVGLFVVAVGIIATTDLASALNAIAEWPVVLQMLLVVGGPVVALLLYSRWVAAAPRAVRPFSLPMAAWRWLQRELRRYHALKNLGIWKKPLQVKGGRGAALTAPIAPMVIFLTFGPHLHRTTSGWGSTLELWHPLMLGLMVVMYWPNLICKDLHWRMLLAPGGLHRGRLGFYIVRSTAEQTFNVACAMLLGAWVIGTMFSAVPNLDVLGLLQRYSLMPLQLVFTISVTTLLRSLPRAGWVFGGFMGVLLASGAAYLGYQSQLPAPPEWFRVGPAYVAFLITSSAAAIALSNRLWTAQKLMGAGAFGGQSSS